MKCVSVCGQPVSTGPVSSRREAAQVYTIGGVHTYMHTCIHAYIHICELDMMTVSACVCE